MESCALALVRMFAFISACHAQMMRTTVARSSVEAITGQPERTRDLNARGEDGLSLLVVTFNPPHPKRPTCRNTVPCKSSDAYM